MNIVRVVTKIMYFKIDDAILARLAEQTAGTKIIDKCWEYRKHIDAHHDNTLASLIRANLLADQRRFLYLHY